MSYRPAVKAIRDSILGVPLFRNSLLIMATLLVNSLVGLAFWLMAARYYSEADIGEATALISLMYLIVLMSGFGFDQSIVRFFPSWEKGRVLFTSVVISTILGIVVGIVLISSFWLWFGGSQVFENAAFFLVLLGVSLVMISISMTSAAFVALRKPQFYFLQNLAGNSKLVFLVIFAFIGSIGIFASIGLSAILALIVSLVILHRIRLGPMAVDMDYAKESFRFSALNHVVILLGAAPALIVPMMLLAMLGPADTGRYFIAYSCASWLLMIPAAIGSSLYVEGSHGVSLGKSARQSLVAIFVVLTPAILLMFAFGKQILAVFGDGYVQAFGIVQYMALSVYMISIWTVYSSIKKVERKIGALVLLSAVTFVMQLALGYVFIGLYGITGIGYSWLVSYGVCGLLIGVDFAASRIRSQRH